MTLQHSTANPWLTIWTRPRATIRAIVDADPSHQVLLLTCLWGFIEALDTASERSSGDSLPIPVVFALCAVLGPISGLIGIMISGWILSWSGTVLGGVATAAETRAALAWSSVPSIWGASVWVVYLAVFGSEMFTTATPRMDANPQLSQLYLWLEGIRLIILLWTLVVTLKCLGEVHGFSAWRALGAMLLAGLLIAALLVPVMCLAIGFLTAPGS